ncbi:MAG: D-amino acid aminotransferase [Thermoleophilia bacterium]
MGDLLYLNGEYKPLETGRLQVEERGFLFGDGVYEVVKVLNGRPLWLDQHLERLSYSLTQIALPLALVPDSLPEVVEELARRVGLACGIVYVQITRGAAPRDFAFPADVRPTVVAYTRALPLPGEEELRRGVRLHPLSDVRWGRCDIKSTNLLAAVLAKNEARSVGRDEPVWLGPDEVVREGGSSNVFALVSGALRTHPADNRVLNGITRLNVLRLAPELNVEAVEEPFSLDELENAEEAFIASTTNDILPVLAVGDTTVGDGRPGPVTLSLLNALRAEAAELAGLPRPRRLGA